jgi:hypothetical protein
MQWLDYLIKLIKACSLIFVNSVTSALLCILSCQRKTDIIFAKHWPKGDVFTHQVLSNALCYSHALISWYSLY